MLQLEIQTRFHVNLRLVNSYPIFIITFSLCDPLGVCHQNYAYVRIINFLAYFIKIVLLHLFAGDICWAAAERNCTSIRRQAVHTSHQSHNHMTHGNPLFMVSVVCVFIGANGINCLYESFHHSAFWVTYIYLVEYKKLISAFSTFKIFSSFNKGV